MNSPHPHPPSDARPGSSARADAGVASTPTDARAARSAGAHAPIEPASTATPQRPRQPWTIARRITVLALVPAALVLAVGAGVLRQQMHAALYGSFAQTLQDKHQRVAARLRLNSHHTVSEPVGSTDEFSTIYSGWYWQASAAGVVQAAALEPNAGFLPADTQSAGEPGTAPATATASHTATPIATPIKDTDAVSEATDSNAVGSAVIPPAVSANTMSSDMTDASPSSGNPSSLGVSRSLWDAAPLVTQATGPQALQLLAARGPLQEPLLGWSAPASASAPNSARAQAITLTVFGPAAALQASLQRIDHILLASFLALMVLLAALLAVQLRLGLLPLRRFAQAVAAQRQPGAAPAPSVQDLAVGADLAPLQQELHGLLQHNAQVVSRARAHAADLNHALKKPLALLTASASRGTAVASAEVLAHTQAMGQLIDRYQARSMSDALHAHASAGQVPVLPVLQQVLAAMRRLHAAQALDWQLATPRTADGRPDPKPNWHWRGDATDLEEALGNLLDNAGKWAASSVRVSLSELSSTTGQAVDAAGRTSDASRSRQLRIDIEDDGPGLSPAQLASAGQRGLRFDESVTGTGLGLAIARQIAEAYGGELRLGKSDALKGLRATLVLTL